MSSHDHDAVDREGIGFVHYQIPKLLGGWIFREQTTSDYGVDGHVEIVTEGKPTGRLVGLQIKTGKSRFVNRTESGWVYRPSDRHTEYWLRHSLPMYLLLVDTSTETIYWQIVDESTVTRGPRGGRVVNVPESNTLANVSAHWLQASSVLGGGARENFKKNLEHLPPSVSGRLLKHNETSKIASEWLTAHLALGRTAPELTARTLLANSPSWMEDLGADGWIAVGHYAYSHDAPFEAADAFERAGGLNPEIAGQMKFSAAGALGAVDPDRARDLFNQAFNSADAALIGEIGLSVLELGTHAAGRPDEALIARAQSETNDVVAVSFLARHFSNTGRRDEAVRLWERALELDAENAELFCGLSTELDRRARTTDRRADDSSRALELATRAVEQLHQWAGPSIGPLNHLLHLLLLDNDYAGTLDRALPEPRGRATASEAAHPEVLTAAVLAADGLGDRELIDELLSRLPNGMYQDFARASLSENDRLAPEERKTLWENVLSNVDATTPRELVTTVTRLAHLGIDASERLHALVDTQVVTAERVDLIRSIAAAVGDLDGALPTFRAQADENQTAAYTLIQLLQDADRMEDAVLAAEDAAIRFSEPRFSLMQADLLCAQGRFDSASDVLQSVVNAPGLADSARIDTHAFLARRAAVSNNWPEIRRQCEAALAAGGSEPRLIPIAWFLAETYLRLSRADLAVDLIRRRALIPNTAAEGKIWAWAVSAEPITESRAAAMLELALKFSDDPLLSGNLLTSIIMRTREADPDSVAGPLDDRVVVADTIRRRTFEELDRHIDAHGSATPVRRIRADSPGELRERLVAEVERLNRPVAEAATLATRGEIPLGLFAFAAGRSLAYTLAGRILGLYVSGSLIEEESSAEDTAVPAALNDQVAVDMSALMVGSMLADFPTLRGHFRRLLIPRDCAADVEAAKAEVRGVGNSSGTLGWDHVHERPVYLDPDVDHQLASLRRLNVLERAMQHTTQVEVAELPSFGDEDAVAHLAWLGPIALAKQYGCSLWSDDVAVRKVARSIGVASFGTMALLDHLLTRRVEASPAGDLTALDDIVSNRRQEMRNAARERIVDVPLGVEELAKEAAESGFPLDLAQCTVGRPGWWILTADVASDLDDLLLQIEDPLTANAWRAIAMSGAAQIGRWDKNRASTFMTFAALLGYESAPPPEAIAGSLRIAAEVGARNQIGDLTRTFQATANVFLESGVEWLTADFVRSVLDDLGPTWPGQMA